MIEHPIKNVLWAYFSTYLASSPVRNALKNKCFNFLINIFVFLNFLYDKQVDYEYFFLLKEGCSLCFFKCWFRGKYWEKKSWKQFCHTSSVSILLWSYFLEYCKQVVVYEFKLILTRWNLKFMYRFFSEVLVFLKKNPIKQEKANAFDSQVVISDISLGHWLIVVTLSFY